MASYLYRNSKGEEINELFPMGTAPQVIGDFKRVITIPHAIILKGGVDSGWSKNQISNKPDYKVSWDTVFNHINQCETARKAKVKADHKHLKTFIADHL